MDHWVMDYETLWNCFLGVFEHYKKDEVKVFTVGKLRNDLPALLEFFKQNIQNNEWHVSFNGLAFDSQITEYILRNRNKLLQMTGEKAAEEIYNRAQDCIGKQERNEFQEFPEKKLSIKQIDVFKLNHWDNPAKRSSLKWIQTSMDWHNVQDMPIPHYARVETVEQLQEIALYCRNDVSSTKEIMKKSAKQIKLRGDLTDDYGINLYSASEPKIAKELFPHFLSQKTGVSKWDLKSGRTNRTEIRVKDILLPYLEFNDFPEIQDLVNKFKKLVINPNHTKGGFKYSVKYRGIKTDFGLGGLHGARKGIFESTEDLIIMSSDVTSFYPNLAIRNGWAPDHLPRMAFCEQYEWFFDERKKIPKKDPRNYTYKIILNSSYGLSNDRHSFLYDPEFTMRITINGQLSLMLLYVMLAEGVPGAIPIMQNTDGLEMIIPKEHKEKYLEICKTWEDMTKLQLEHDEYQKLIVPDVNNYIGVFKYNEVTKEEYQELQEESPDDLFKEEAGKFYYAATKCKGRFVFRDLPLHKNKSFLIVRKALFHFFVHDIPPEQFLTNNRNIFDYCGMVKIKGDWKFVETCLEDDGLTTENLQKTIRYYITHEGCKLIKVNNSDGREIKLESGPWLQRVFNVYEELPWQDHDINEKFYLQKIYKEIGNLEQSYRQTSLFN